MENITEVVFQMNLLVNKLHSSAVVDMVAISFFWDKSYEPNELVTAEEKLLC